MELLDFPIRINSITEKVYIHVFGDIHRAANGCDSLQLHSDINQLKKANERKDEHHYWIGTGDWMNAVGVKDKRHDAAAIAPEFRDYTGANLFGAEESALVSDFRPIAEWGIGIMSGNHEDSIARFSEFDPADNIARRLGLPYLGYSAAIRFRLKHNSPSDNGRGGTIVCYCHHGYGAARTKGAKLNKLHSLRDVIDADVYVIGHDHELIDFPEARLSLSRRGALRLIERKVLYVNGGTYQKSHPAEKRPQRAGQYNEERIVRPDYAEKKAYRPSVIGHNGFCMYFHHRRKTEPMQIELKRVDFRR